MEPMTWKDGQLQPCSLKEFTRGLRRMAAWADDNLGVRSDPGGHVGERLDAAADLIDEMAASRGQGG